MNRTNKSQHLFTWIGQADLNALKSEETKYGPIHAALFTGEFAHASLLSDYGVAESQNYVNWLRNIFPKISLTLELTKLESPMDYHGIHQVVTQKVDFYKKENPNHDLCFHSSPGTPAMAVVWILLGETRYNARIIRSHYDVNKKENIVTDVNIPFSLSAEFIDRVVRVQDNSFVDDLDRRADFEHIIYRSSTMQHVVERARQIAQRNVPVLIEGESGTGKELLAKAIHKASSRHQKAFVALNCGAIPAELFESEIFGHVKGAYTGANRDRLGAFREAHGGTLFLDEIGELPLEQQVKLLRTLQERTVRPIGADEAEEVDVRIICATHRHLYQDVHEHRFREDLFHRIAVGVLSLPPLRSRLGDMGLLIDHFLATLHEEHAITPIRTLSPEARQRALNHHWPGNIRELRNTLLRAIIWSRSDVIEWQEMDEAILRPPVSSHDVLERPLDEGFNIGELLDEIKRHYIQRAMKQSDNTKSRAATLLGLKNHQTLTSWMEKLSLSS